MIGLFWEKLILSLKKQIFPFHSRWKFANFLNYSGGLNSLEKATCFRELLAIFHSIPDKIACMETLEADVLVNSTKSHETRG